MIEGTRNAGLKCCMDWSTILDDGADGIIGSLDSGQVRQGKTWQILVGV
jgi:hypothetical protein